MPSAQIADRIRTRMAEKGLSVAQLSAISTVSDSTIGRIINNRCNGISPTTIRLLAAALDYTPAELTGIDLAEKPAVTPEAITYALDTVRDTYIDRITTAEDLHAAELSRLDELYRARLADIKGSRNMLACFCAVLLALIVAMLILFV